MKHSPTQDLIAIGGEDGIVRLYDVIDTTDDNCLQYNKSFERQDSRILSICWLKFSMNFFSKICTGEIFEKKNLAKANFSCKYR